MGASMPKKHVVIHLSNVKAWQDINGCRHMHVLIDERYAEVECADCGKKLNPINVLARFAYEENNLERSIKAKNELEQRLKDRVRTKCIHCGKMTPLRIS
jgi:hypothetical protein